MKILNPAGQPATSTAGLSPRLASISGKVIGVIDNQKENANFALEAVIEELERRKTGAKIVCYDKLFPAQAAHNLDEIVSQCDAVINGVGHCGASSSWTTHDSIDIERLGRPTATLCTDQFAKLTNSMAESLGIGGLPLVFLRHPLSNTPVDVVKDKAREVVDGILEALTTPTETLDKRARSRSYPMPRAVCPFLPPSLAAEDTSQRPTTDLTALEFDAADSLDDVTHQLYAWGYTDGLPVIPPTRDRVARMLDAVSSDPQADLGPVPPMFGRATVEKVAINAVMAGCRPEYLPVVLAAVEAVLDPGYALEGRQTTTHAGAPLIIVNGPISDELGINYGAGCLGSGWRANATIGRALRLVLTNIGGALPGIVDSATHGHPGKYTVCFAENEGASPWTPLHEDRGYSKEVSTVTLVHTEAPHSINDARSKTARGLMTTVASTMCTLGVNNIYYQGQPVLVLGPEHAQLLAKEGWSKQDVKAYIHEFARQPARLVRDRGMEIGREFPQWIDLSDDDAMVPIIDKADDLIVVVSGGGGPKSMCVPTSGRQSLSVTRPITAGKKK